MITIRTQIILVVLAVSLSGCGGGGGGASAGNVNSPGNQSPSNTTPAKGIFIDSPVSGLEYTGSPSGMSGITGESGVNGEFTVATADTVTFKLGNLVVGVSPPVVNGSIITPASLAASFFPPISPQATRIAQLLQSLDFDRNASNGINIAPAVRDRLRDGSVNAGALQQELQTGQGFDTTLGGMIQVLTSGNANRAHNEVVSNLNAQTELLIGSKIATKLNFIWRSTGAPVAIATVSFSTLQFTPVFGVPAFPLDGTRSFDPDNQPLTYLWSIISKPPGANPTLSSTTSATTSLTFPDPGVYTVELKVTDMSGLTSTDNITVSNVNSGGPFMYDNPPVADRP